ncbi:MAG TPA: ATP-binding cassette domain-containing protein [Rhizomicrobium sp.]|nr:ATP-binding cassette domain-containing protein [Rhizomicrobium sp.]
MGGLALKGVSKRFGVTPVLDGISLEIGADELVVVLGPSGCGKSTLLRVVAGLETIDAGSIELDGARIDGLPPGKRGVAMVFQSYALYPHMSVRENMAFGLSNTGVTREEAGRRIAEAARMLEMEHLLDRRPSELSGGQRQRAAIGRAIVKAPKLFMFDEPLSNLDAALRSRTRQEIASLHRRIKTAMLFVTHDQTEAMTLADRIVVMNQRRIEQIGTPREIYDFPATEFVAAFVGSPAMNILPAASLPTLAVQGGTMRVGLRPEAVCLRAPGGGDVDAKVEFVEFLGDKTHVFLLLPGGERIVASAGASPGLRSGDTAGIAFDREAVHAFDAQGRNLHKPGPP